LVVAGQKVYANKGILAIHSPIFSNMFYGDFSEKNEKEIELKGIDREMTQLDILSNSRIDSRLQL
ncbi:hypothetical protein PENTCL1PPCAC_22377, partial [Pristionchus entomophagus]